MKNLVVVESPAKAKTIGKFLGDNYNVIASKGHIRDLPKKTFGIKINEKHFEPVYEISEDHAKIVNEIKKLAKKADQIYLATDEDREGEAIAYHIATAIGKEPSSLPRIVFHEITKTAIENAIKNPRALDTASVNAQQARRLLDRIVGYKLSPLLSQKIQKGLSAGRVQSSALKIVVDREREINVFKPEKFYTVNMIFKKDLEAEFVKFKNKKIEKMSIKTAKEADEIVQILCDEKFEVSKIESKDRKTNPYPPFMTSTLQQNASTALGFSPKKTMNLAQSLYEGVNAPNGGAITYMRTDSLNIAKEAIGISEIQNVFAKSGSSLFKILGRKVKFDGFYKIYGENDKDKILPDFKIGDELKVQNLKFVENQTEPPARYSEASLIKKLESLGIGRPSTYAPTLSLLISRKYVNTEKKQLVPTEIAFKIVEMLEQNFNNIVDSEFTSKMETKLDEIAEKSADWQEILADFYYPFMEKIAIGKKNIKSQKVAEPIGEKCPECGGELLKRNGRFGEFIACSNFPKCRYSRNLSGEQKIKKEPAKIGVKCPECGGEIVERVSKRGKFYGCSNYPKCNFISNYKPTNEKCPECGEMLFKKSLKKGDFLYCAKCKFQKAIDD